MRTYLISHHRSYINEAGAVLGTAYGNSVLPLPDGTRLDGPFIRRHEREVAEATRARVVVVLAVSELPS
jgi:hypothetical protein